METKFLKDALFAGMTANAFKLGSVLSMGWFWVRTAGCHHIYRGRDGNLGDYDQVQALMELSDSEVTIANQDLPAGSSFHYIRRRLSDCGLESPDSETCIVRIDGDGSMMGLLPNTPDSLRAETVAGGKIRLRWRYTAIQQETAPTQFHIYMDSGSGFNFDTPDATIPYHAGAFTEFTWLSDALSDGQIYRFCVRADSATGQGRNTNFVSAAADATGPAAVGGVEATWSEE